jgi:hypothetical protein
MTGWWVASLCPTASTIQSIQTAGFQAGLKEAVFGEISAGIVLAFRSLVTVTVSRADFGLPSPHPKIPFPAEELDGRNRLGIGEPWEAKPGLDYWGFNPSASNCRPHSDGASRKRSTPMPRGNRPSTAALTRSGARKASEIVMLTWRTLHFCRVAIC